MNSSDLQAALVAARAKGIPGTGILVVDGSIVAAIKSIDYSADVKLYEQVLGAAGGAVYERDVIESNATLKVEYTDVYGNLELFTWNSATVPSNGILPAHIAGYYGFKGPTILFDQCNIIPGGFKPAEANWGSGSLELKTVGGSMPSVSSASAFIPMELLSDVPADTTVVAESDSLTATTDTLSIEGKLIVDGKVI